jgi:hypothetical protein
MHPAATSRDFERQPQELQERLLAVLEVCREERLSMRCEMVGNDFTIVIAPGFGAASYWIDRLTEGGTLPSKPTKASQNDERWREHWKALDGIADAVFALADHRAVRYSPELHDLRHEVIQRLASIGYCPRCYVRPCECDPEEGGLL